MKTILSRPFLIGLLGFSLLSLGLLGCQNSQAALYHPYFDAMVVESSDKRQPPFELSNPIVSDLNLVYEFEKLFYYEWAGLDENGEIVAADDSSVLSLYFTDTANQLHSFDDKHLVLQLQIEDDGTISNGSFASSPAGVASFLDGKISDSLVAGQALILYKDRKVVIGQLDARFRSFDINASFRALVREHKP